MESDMLSREILVGKTLANNTDLITPFTKPEVRTPAKLRKGRNSPLA